MKFSRGRDSIFRGILTAFLLFFCELTFRFGLKISFFFPFWQPGTVLKERFYPEAYRMRDSIITQTDGYFDILILGGSVVADEWHSTVGRRLRDTLIARTGNARIRYWCAANLGQSSGDNLFKYRLLEKQRFDLVLYYEAINETRLNNIPRSQFRSDYTHYHWYDEVKLINQHPELNYTVIPFTLHLVASRLGAALGFRRYIRQRPHPDDQQHGGDLKTPPIYRANLEALKTLARQRSERLLLANFTYYIPENWRRSGFKTGADYSQCGLWSPIETWGFAQHVEKGILAHRQMMSHVAKGQPGVEYFDMLPTVPKEGKYFCDICHLTEAGSAAFAAALAGHIIKQRLIAPPPLLASTKR